VYGKKRAKQLLTDVHFIRLNLTDSAGKPVSDNFYWRANKLGDYTALNTLPAAKLEVKSTIETIQGKKQIRATIKNIGSSVAFAVHVQPYRRSDGERILPLLMNENYFTLLQNESKEIVISFDASLLDGNKYDLRVTPYNNQ
jgi:hypothetical protein